MEIRLLGPVELWSAGREIPLGRPRQRCVLTALAVTPGQPVGMDQLLARVWGERLPGDARNVVYTHVSRLRRLLEQAGAGSGQGTVRRAGGGYLLDVEPDLVDLHRFRRLAAEAHGLDGRGDQRAVELLDEASGLWRGVPLAGLDGDWVERTRAGIVQERLVVQTDGFAARLRLGRHAALVGPLSDLVADHRLDESLAGLLMLALYRCGRPADALRVYAGLRQGLVDEIGDEPGERLRRLHEQILRRDPTLDEAPVPAHHRGEPVPPAQLPADVAGFTGRASDLARLDALLPPDGRQAPVALVISAVEGIPGVGKTALAVHWAHRVQDRFADGQLYLNMRGYAPDPPMPPIEALARLLRALGIAAERVPADMDEAASIYRSLLADKRMLVVLDNVASADQVRPLLPGGGGSVVLVTSRDQLSGLVARDGAHCLTLDVLPAEDATALLTRILGPERAGAESERAVAELAELCGRLPLALRIAAANLVARPRQRVADYVARLRSADRLAALAVAGDPQSAVLVSFDLSYARIPPAARRMFRLLGLVPGPDVTAAAAAALADLGLDEAERLLELVAGAHLVEEHAAGRYTCHDLLRRYAADLAAREEPEPDRDAVQARLCEYYLGTADAAARVLYPEKLRLPADPHHARPAATRFDDHDRALAWLDDELPCLVAVTRHAGRHGPRPVAWLLSDTLRGYFWLRRDVFDWLATGEAALAAALAERDRSGEAATRLSLGDAHQTRGGYRQAIDHYQHAVRVSRHLEGSEIRLAVLTNLGYLHVRAGRLRAAADCYEQVLTYVRQGGLTGEALELGNLGSVYRAMGQLERSADLHAQALAAHRRSGNRNLEAGELRELGEVCHVLGRFDQARALLTEALALHRLVGCRAGETWAQLSLSALNRDSGRVDVDLSRTALALAGEIGDAYLEADALNTLATVHHRLGRYRQAADHHRQALRKATQMDFGHPLAEALIGLAAAHLRLGEHGQAHDLLTRAIGVIEDAGFRLLQAQALTVLAEVHLAEGDLAAAAMVGEHALSAHRETGHRLGEARTHTVLGHIRRRTGDTDAAHEHQHQAHALFADIGIPPAPPKREVTLTGWESA